MLKLAPATTLTLLLGPVLAGLLAIVLPAFGYFPALGGTNLSLEAWRGLLATPGLTWSLWLSFGIGLITTLLSLVVVIIFCAAFQGTRGFALVRRLLAPLLSVPHVALALGLAFADAPSGLLMRWLSPWASGLTLPPDLLIINDPNGLALMAGLLLKEIPFLFLMTLAALPQADARQALMVARSLGYPRIAAWLKAVFPRVYPQLRLPVLAVLAFSASVADVALILGPTPPPPLAVQTLRWAQDPDLALLFQASAAGLLQLAVVLAAIGLWLLGERSRCAMGKRWLERGDRRCSEHGTRAAAMLTSALVGLIVALAVFSLALWSATETWRFPDAWPSGFTLRRSAGRGRTGGIW
jgi:putative thiamine transport system permease protein